MVKKENKKELTINVNVISTTSKDLDPQSDFTNQWPIPIEDIETFKSGRESHHYSKIGQQMENAMRKEVEQVLHNNLDLFAWSAFDMPNINPNFIFHKLVIFLEAKAIAQRKHKLGKKGEKL